MADNLADWLSGVDGPEGHAGVAEHLWGALFPQQSGHDTLGLYIEPREQAWTWVTESWFSCSSHVSLHAFHVWKMYSQDVRQVLRRMQGWGDRINSSPVETWNS